MLCQAAYKSVLITQMQVFAVNPKILLFTLFKHAKVVCKYCS